MTTVHSRVVEVCAFRMQGEFPEYLLLRRAPTEPIYPGLWQIITGTIEGEERATDAALRELREETGQVPEQLWVVPYTNAFYDHGRDAVSLIPFFAARYSPAVQVHLSAEHAAHAWLAFAPARERLVWPGQRAGLDIVHHSIVGGEDAPHLIAIPR
ncbi:MAG: NUDIX domain-containing protein [Bacteroidota bacterium]